MDVDTLRSLVTVLAFTAFVGIVVWACSGSRRREFETASRLPFEGEPSEVPVANEPT
jgi:cytochrome c oxidase cbb3-type subunit 4